MTRSVFLFVLVLVAVVNGAGPELVVEKADPFDFLTPTSFTLTSNYRSKYVFTTAANLYNDPVVQTDLFVLTKCGLYFDVWGSVPTDFGNIGENYGTELYWNVGWLGKAGEYNVNVGAGYEDLYLVLNHSGSDFFIITAEVSRDFSLNPNFVLSPFARIEVNFTFDGITNGDSLAKGGTRFAWNLGSELALAGKAMLVYDPGIYGADVALAGTLEAGLQWKLGKNMTFELPYVRYVEPLNDVNDGRKGEFITGFGVSIKF